MDGELQFYIKIARDDNNFYMYRTPINSGTSKAAWLPEISVSFNRLFALRAQIQNAYLQGKQRNTCTGLDSVLIANTPLPAGSTATSRYAACDDGYIVYTLDPGVSPPNLAAVQELAVGMLRLPVSPGANPILPTDTLEVWVDDIRLAGVVNQAGFAGQTGLTIIASDFADIRINASRRDPNFRQLAEQPTFLTDNNWNVSSAFHLEKLLPASLGLSIPFTVNYTSAAIEPLYLSQSDIQGDAIEGLRTPRSAATSFTLSLRRTKQSTGSIWSPILNNLSLNSSYTTGASRSEYEDGKAKNFVVGLDFNLSRALLPELSRWSPTELHLTSVLHERTRRPRVVPQAGGGARRFGASGQRTKSHLAQWQQPRVSSLQGGVGSLGHHLGARPERIRHEFASGNRRRERSRQGSRLRHRPRA